MPLAMFRTNSRAAFLTLVVVVLVLQLLATCAADDETTNEVIHSQLIGDKIISFDDCLDDLDETDDFFSVGENNGSYSSDNVYADFDWKDYVFLSFRFGLFAFIICFPCFRGIRIWYLAGGRIRFLRTGGRGNNGTNNNNGNGNNGNTRNNNNGEEDIPRGWIIGLRYQAADLDRWLILSGYGQPVVGGGTSGAAASNNGARKLTSDEVYALPEILAPPVVEDDFGGGGEGGGDGDIEMGVRDDLAATYHGNIDSNNKHNNATTGNSEIELVSATETESETESPPPPLPSAVASATTPANASASASAATLGAPAPTLFTTTMSTQCSICIDDFECGEKIRLLPRCGHAFHTECILPWLTERQGVCPCCKAPVICPPSDDEESKDGDGEDENGNSNSNSADNTSGDIGAAALRSLSDIAFRNGLHASNSNNNSNSNANHSFSTRGNGVNTRFYPPSYMRENPMAYHQHQGGSMRDNAINPFGLSGYRR